MQSPTTQPHAWAADELGRPSQALSAWRWTGGPVTIANNAVLESLAGVESLVALSNRTDMSDHPLLCEDEVADLWDSLGALLGGRCVSSNNSGTCPGDGRD